MLVCEGGWCDFGMAFSPEKDSISFRIVITAYDATIAEMMLMGDPYATKVGVK